MNELIARTWRGTTLEQNREAYLDYLRKTGLHAYEQTPGNRGLLALSRTVDGRAEFLLISLWDSLEAVRAFAGTDISRAVFYPRDDQFLIDRDLTVSHYDVLFHQGLRLP